jgi:hypothetical protein
MRMQRWFLIGLIFAGLVAAETLAAQSPPAQPQRQQRAHGVPMAPNASEAQKVQPDSERSRALQERERLARDRSTPLEPKREIPMPKPVPSIIAPSR